MTPKLHSHHVILQLVPTLNEGGAERTTVEIARALKKTKASCLVASHGGRLSLELEKQGARLLTLPLHRKTPWHIIYNGFCLITILRRHKVSLIHARSRAPAWSALLASRLTGVPMVTTYHSKVHKKPALKVFYNSVMTRGRAVIANSKYNAQRIKQVHKTPARHVITIVRGCDEKKFLLEGIAKKRIQKLQALWQWKPNHFVVLLPGRLTPWKGQSQAIKAIQKLARNTALPPIQLVLVGDNRPGPYEKRLRESAREITRENPNTHVVFAGHCADMPAAYALSDVVVMPSTKPEPFGRIAIEAQAAGKPIIASNHGGPKETILDFAKDPRTATGFLIAPSPHGIAKALAQVIAMKKTARHAMGRRGMNHIKRHFTLKVMQQSTLNVYKQLLAQRPG